MLLPWEFMQEVGVIRWFSRTGVRQFCKRILRRDQTFQLPTGLQISLPRESRFGTEVYLTRGNVDWGSEGLLAAYLKHQPSVGCILDAGANIGYYSLYLSPMASRVYAFEPDPRALAALHRNASHGSNIEVCECALGERQGTASFVLGGSSEVSHLLQSQESASAVQVRIETVDDFVAARGIQVSCMKVDTEGHEMEVFRGARNTMANQRPVILAESNPDEPLFGLMQDLSYRVFAYVRDANTNQKRFRELLPRTELRGRIKMLFLVPMEKAEEIASLSRP